MDTNQANSGDYEDSVRGSLATAHTLLEEDLASRKAGYPQHLHGWEMINYYIARAQVYATLALAAATQESSLRSQKGGEDLLQGLREIT